MADVSTPKTLRYQCLDRHAQEVLTRELEEPFCLRVEDDHLAFAIDDDDRVGRCLEETPKPCFDFLPRGGVSNDADDESARLGLQRAQADFDGNSLPSLRRPASCIPAPIGRGTGCSRYRPR